MIAPGPSKSAGDSRNPQATPPPPQLKFVAVAVIGLLAGVIAQEWRWRAATQNPQGDLSVAEKALQSGDDKTALVLLNKLAEQNNPNARYWLGYMTERGLGVPRNSEKAIELYKKAAAENVVFAELRLGEIYLHGNLVLPDYSQAKVYLEKAAYHGEARAAMLLGRMYDLGLGVAANTKEAYAWSEVAVIEGSVFAKLERDATLRDLSVNDKKDAIARAQDIIKDIKQETAMPQVPNSK